MIFFSKKLIILIVLRVVHYKIHRKKLKINLRHKSKQLCCLQSFLRLFKLLKLLL